MDADIDALAGTEYVRRIGDTCMEEKDQSVAEELRRRLPERLWGEWLMTSLIDRDALIAEYDRVHVGEAGKARKLMEEAPEVDAVPVVRCKDCKYRKPKKTTNLNSHCVWYNRAVMDDDYCSKAERKEE